jgi:uncharacterized damage-inducible protein DinB
MTADYIRVLLDYNYWARDRALASAEPLSPEEVSRAMGSSFPSVLDTLVHIYSAEWIWYRRWQGESSARPDATRLVSVAALRAAWLPLEQQIRSFVDGLGPAGLSRIVDYKTLGGQPSASPYWQMIVHVVNHGTYHRGQVASLLRQLGAKPAQSTDMIQFFREQSAHTR